MRKVVAEEPMALMLFLEAWVDLEDGPLYPVYTKKIRLSP
jgi:hypothetical protein